MFKSRSLHHDFSDKFDPTPQILCYSIDEILAEKTRALVQRKGRARDIYDVVNISRHLKNQIQAQNVRHIANKKFTFKNLEKPSVTQIINGIDVELLEANWNNQLAHQIANLPSVDSYLEDLKKALTWWLA